MTRQRRDVYAAKQMVHDRVADNDYLIQIITGSRTVVPRGTKFCPARNQLACHSAELPANQPLQFRLSTAQGEVNAAHDVAAVPGLHIQRRADGENITSSQIKKLRGNGGGSQLNGHAEALTRRKLEGGLIAQDGHLPLRQLEFEITRDGMPARQTPARSEEHTSELQS